MSLDTIKLIEATGEQGNYFVGIKIVENHIEFHYPAAYNLSSVDNEKELRNDILAILSTITLSDNQSNEISKFNSLYKDNKLFPIESYLWLINDYLTYGRYENREKKYVEGVLGKVSWKKTMRNNPVISNKNVIYTKIVSEKDDQKENIITEIYKCCVKLAIDSIGWIYGLSFDSEGIDYDFLVKSNYDTYLYTLFDAISKTYDDIKKIRLNHMKNVLTGLDTDSFTTKQMTYGVDGYEYVYERMIDNMFSNVDDIKQFYPNATIDLVLEHKSFDSSNLRPDTIIVDKENRKAYIIDAKYYRYGVTFNPNHIPGTDSIQKQVTYGEYLKRMQDNNEIDEIYSAFIIPYSKIKNMHNDRFNKDIEFIGISTTKWYDDDGSKNRKVAMLLIDLNCLVNNWFNKNNCIFEKELIDEIEKNIEKGVKHE